MKIVNRIKFDPALLRELINFAQPANVTHATIAFRYAREYHGRAFTGRYHSKLVRRSSFGNYDPYRHWPTKRRKRALEEPDVVIYLRKSVRGSGKIEHNNGHGGRGYLGSVEYTQEEAILHLLAHEMRHLWQVKIPSGWRVWGARGRYSERDCDAYAIRVVRHWRRKGSPFYGPKGEVVK
jgi:hypothetical protein